VVRLSSTVATSEVTIQTTASSPAPIAAASSLHPATRPAATIPWPEKKRTIPVTANRQFGMWAVSIGQVCRGYKRAALHPRRAPEGMPARAPDVQPLVQVAPWSWPGNSRQPFEYLMRHRNKRPAAAADKANAPAIAPLDDAGINKKPLPPMLQPPREIPRERRQTKPQPA